MGLATISHTTEPTTVAIQPSQITKFQRSQKKSVQKPFLEVYGRWIPEVLFRGGTFGN